MPGSNPNNPLPVGHFFEDEADVLLRWVMAMPVSGLLLDKSKLRRPDCGMRSFRILLALLIALALPAQALADARMVAGCCPMAAAEADVQETMTLGHDCCHEHDADGDGKSCDAGSGCHCGAHLALATPIFLPAVHERGQHLTVFSFLPHPAPPDAHWRPPATRTA